MPELTKEDVEEMTLCDEHRKALEKTIGIKMCDVCDEEVKPKAL